MGASYVSPHGRDGGDEHVMSRRGATLTGVLAAGLTATVGYAGAQMLVLGPSAPADSGGTAVARASGQLGSLQGGPSRSVASAPSPQTQSYSAPQATYTPAAPVASTSSS